MTAKSGGVERVLEQHQFAQRDKLIPILQQVQESEGYISKEAVLKVSRHLGVPASKIYGVATFYNQFRFSPIGRNNIVVCRGTACHVKGSAALLKALEDMLGIKAGETTADGLFSIEVVACMGACGLAPVISVNGECHAAMTPEKASHLLDQIRAEEKQHAQ
ncbi:MAG: NADH-quinone oxidoreductase subunit NuoE [Elusimicrobia bacterium]|nr:NADH-quinone oxidoreductase subunit NuoE [Elusimicrobiota bacterium]